MSIIKNLILQILNFHVRDLSVSPLDEIIFRLRAYDLEVVKADQLPNNGQNVLFVPFNEVATTNAWDFQAELLANLGDLSTINTAFKLVVGIFVNSFPVYTTWREFVADLEDHNTSRNVFVEVIDVNIFNTQAIDPESEGSLVSRALNIIINNAGLLICLLFFLIKFLKTMLSVEELSDEYCEELLVARANIGGANKGRYSNGLSILYQGLSTFYKVILRETCKRALILIKRIENLSQGNRILEV